MDNTVLRQQLIDFLQGNKTHMSLQDAVKDFPMEHINGIFPHGEYTFWHLLEHIRRTQKDMLDFMTDAHYIEPEWPKDYWPARDAKATEKEWQQTLEAYTNDLQTIIALVEDKNTDLLAKVPKGTGQIYLQEFLQIIDHTSYHTGELAIMRQVQDTW